MNIDELTIYQDEISGMLLKVQNFTLDIHMSIPIHLNHLLEFIMSVLNRLLYIDKRIKNKSIMRNLLLIFIISFSCISMLSSQKLIDYELAISVSELVIEVTLGQDVNNGVDAYRVSYTTTDLEGRIDTASGLILIPINMTGPLPKAIYQHGTVGSRNDVPSQLAGGWQLALALASYGYITVAPDFQGLGLSRGIHPYVHADSEALAAIDLLFALEAFMIELDTEVTLNDQLFITGYSQGGHAAMAAHRNIERDYSDDFTVTASAPMSGPYSISNDMVQFTVGDQEYNFVGYLAWTALSYQRAYKETFPSELSDFFKEKYIPAIDSFAREEIDLGQLNEALRILILEESDIVLPKLMIKDDVLDIIINRKEHPITDAFQDNDVDEWPAKAPIRMMYCGADEQVWFQNALTAEDNISSTGAEDVKAVLIDEDGTHGSCVVPASLAMIEFFNSFRDITSSVEDLDKEDTGIYIFPNPTSDLLNISFPIDFQWDMIQIYHADGKLNSEFRSKDFSGSHEISLDVTAIGSGLHHIHIISKNELYNKRIIIK